VSSRGGTQGAASILAAGAENVAVGTRVVRPRNLVGGWCAGLFGEGWRVPWSRARWPAEPGHRSAADGLVGGAQAALQNEIANVIADLQPEEAAAFTERLAGMIAYEAAEGVLLNVAGGAIKAALQNEIANVIADLQPEEAAAFTGRLAGMIAYEAAEAVALNVAGGAIKAGKLPKMIAALEKLPGVDPAKLGQLAKAAGDKALPLIEGLVKRDVDDVVKKVAPNRVARFFDDVATQATRNASSSKVVLGKTLEGGVRYSKVTAHYKATYFKLDNWRELSGQLSRDELWKINESFLNQQLRAGKEVILSHDPSKATGFFLREVDYLKDLGYRFVQDGWVWRAVK